MTTTAIEKGKKEKTPKASGAAFLAQVAGKAVTESPTKAKAASKRAPIEVSKECRESIEKFVAAKKALAEAEAELARHEGTIIEAARTRQDVDGFTGTFEKSYDIQGNDSIVKVVFGNRFSINPEDDDVIAELLGPAKDELIATNFKVVLKADVLKDEEKLTLLSKVVGDRFDEFFTSQKILAVTADFDRRIYAVVKTPEKLADLRNVVRPYKASVRV